MPSRTTVPARSQPYASTLRQRAGHLRDLARSIEQSLVMTLALDVEGVDSAAAPERMRLCDSMLDRNMHQLHQAADDLRYTAHRFQTRADELDAAYRSRTAA